jgi:hypothetical protein
VGGARRTARTYVDGRATPNRFARRTQAQACGNLRPDRFTLIWNQFDRVFASADKARVVPWTCRPQAARNAVRRAREPEPSVGQIGPPAALRRLPDAPHRAAHRALPEEPIWRHQTVPCHREAI